MNQLTVRGFDQVLQRRIREVAKARGISLNQAAVLMLKEGAGLTGDAGRSGKVGDALKKFSGRWSGNDEAEFLEAIAPLEKVDPSFWK